MTAIVTTPVKAVGSVGSSVASKAVSVVKAPVNLLVEEVQTVKNIVTGRGASWKEIAVVGGTILGLGIAYDQREQIAQGSKRVYRYVSSIGSEKSKTEGSDTKVLINQERAQRLEAQKEEMKGLSPKERKRRQRQNKRKRGISKAIGRNPQRKVQNGVKNAKNARKNLKRMRKRRKRMMRQKNNNI